MYPITAPILSVSQVQNTSFLMQAQHVEKTGQFCPLFLPACEKPGGPALLDSDHSWIALIAHLHRGQRVGLMGTLVHIGTGATPRSVTVKPFEWVL